MLVMQKEYYNCYLTRKKYKIGKTVKNNYSATTSYKKPRNYWHKISYCKTFKNFTYNIQDYEAGFDYKVLAKVLIALDIIKQV